MIDSSRLAAVVIAGIVWCLPAAAQEAGEPKRGKLYAEQVCAECHGVQAREVFSPMLGLASFQTIANSPGMTAIALSTFLVTPHRDMPNLVIPAETRADLVAYITSLKE